MSDSHAPSPPRRRGSALDKIADRLGLSHEGILLLFTSLAMMLIGLWKNINLIILLTCFLLALLFFNHRLARRQVRRLTGSRSHDDLIFAGRPVTVAIEVTNPQQRTRFGINLVQGVRRWFLPVLSGSHTSFLETTMVFPRRGATMLEPLQAICGYPLGLARSHKALQPGEELIVMPRLGELDQGTFHRLVQQQSPILGTARTVPRCLPTARAEFHALRDFRQGDSPRWIHWRTSARRGKLMVREFEESPSKNLILIVDAFRDQNLAEADFERLLSLAATLCREWCRQKGDRLVLGIVAGTPTLVEGITGGMLARQALAALAVEEGSEDPDGEALLDQLLRVPLPTAPIVLLSARASPFVALFEQAFHRPIACIDVAVGDEQAFFHWPTQPDRD